MSPSCSFAHAFWSVSHLSRPDSSAFFECIAMRLGTVALFLVCLLGGFCASAWSQDTFILGGPKPVPPVASVPGEVDVTLIVGDPTWYYIVKNVSFPTVQQVTFWLPDAPNVGLTVPGGWYTSTYNSQPGAYYALGETYATWCPCWMMTGTITPGTQAIFSVNAPGASPQLSPVASVVYHWTNAPYCGGPAQPQCRPSDYYTSAALIEPQDCSSGTCPTNETFGTIASTTGTVTLNGNPAVAGESLNLLDTLATGPDGSAAIGSPDGSQVSLSSSSIVQLYGKVSATRFVKILLGRMLAAITPKPDRCANDPNLEEPCDALDVIAPNAVVGVRGTNVVIETDGVTTTTTVNEGTVNVVDLTGGTLNSITSVPAGSALTVGPPFTKATPVITWATPAAIPYGTALSATQLDATANVPGTFVYTPPAGTVLNAGSQALSVTFTPTDATDYSTAKATVALTVAASGPKISPLAVTPVSMSGSAASGYTVVLTLVNTGNVTLDSVTVQNATLDGLEALTFPADTTFDSLVPGAAPSVSATFPGSAGTDGQVVPLSFSGTYTVGATSGNWAASFRRVTLP